MVLLLPFIDSFQRVDLRTRAFNVPPCKVRGFSAPLDWGSGELVLGVLWMSVPWPDWGRGGEDTRKRRREARRASLLYVSNPLHLGFPFCSRGASDQARGSG